MISLTEIQSCHSSGICSPCGDGCSSWIACSLYGNRVPESHPEYGKNFRIILADPKQGYGCWMMKALVDKFGVFSEEGKIGVKDLSLKQLKKEAEKFLEQNKTTLEEFIKKEGKVKND